jgi:hypothetical protein
MNMCLLQDKVVNVYLFLNKIFFHIKHMESKLASQNKYYNELMKPLTNK